MVVFVLPEVEDFREHRPDRVTVIRPLVRVSSREVEWVSPCVHRKCHRIHMSNKPQWLLRAGEEC